VLFAHYFHMYLLFLNKTQLDMHIKTLLVLEGKCDIAY